MSHAHKLADFSTRAPSELDKDRADKLTDDLKDRLKDQQRRLYANKDRSLLVILQGMDASGKDGASRAITHSINPTGFTITSFKKPTEEEFAHDFLWRIHKVAPAKGMIKIFNRSHYEDVLIQRVHKWIDMETVHRRFRHINDFERLLTATGTTILKCYLHVSKEEQIERLNERIELRRKNYKHNPNDFKEREHWDSYMEAYEDCFEHCGPDVPWHIIPTDQNWCKEYYLLKLIVETLEGMKMEYPGIEEED